MNKGLILLLVALAQNQSHGVVLSNPNTDVNFQDSQLEDWAATDSPYPGKYDLSSQPYRKRSIANDALTRRSALDKNFMRFGRGGDTLRKQCGGEREEGKIGFYRFGHGVKDDFMRSGRARENFIRFGRGGGGGGGGGGGKDGFIRFGRTPPEDLFRAEKSLRENFIRFGKADKNFVRFGRENAEEDYQDFFSSMVPFHRLGKSSRAQDHFLRFGKSGKNGTNFLRFGKSYAESVDAVEGDQDPNILKEAKRKRRDAGEELPARSSKKSESKKSTGFFEAPPNDFLLRISPSLEGSWQNLENLRNSRLTSFFRFIRAIQKALTLTSRKLTGILRESVL